MWSCRNQRKKRALADTKDRYHALLEENRQLLQRHEEAQKESYTVTEHLRSEIVTKNAAIIQLQADIERVRHQLEQRMHQATDLCMRKHVAALKAAPH